MENKKASKNIILIIILVIFCICLVPVELQNDTYFSVAVGNQILENGIDMQEHLTWHQDLMYTYSHWLFDIFNIVLFNLGGFKLIHIAVVLMTITIAIVLYNVLKKLNNNSYIIPFLITLLVIILGFNFFTARAQIVTYLLFILEVYFIEKLLETNKKRYIISLIIIPILIANFHAAVWPFYFVFYLPYIAEAFFNHFKISKINLRKISRLKARLNIEQDEDKKQKILKQIQDIEEENEDYKKINTTKKIYINEHKYIKTLIILFFITMLTGLLTPIHDTPYTYIFKTMNGISKQYISELRPAVILYDIGFAAYCIVLTILLASNKVKINLADCFMICGLLAMSVVSVRSQAYLLFIGCIPLTRLIFSYVGTIDFRILDKTYENIKRNKFICIVLFIYILTLALSIYTDISLGKNLVNEKLYPVKASEYILGNVDIENMKLYNGFNYGSYLEYKGIPVFIDSRSEMYTVEYNGVTIFQDFVDVKNGEKTYYEIFEKYGITHILVPVDDMLAKYLVYDDNYKLLYEDDNFVLYTKIN